MTKKLFGTDGIRGTVNEGAIRPDVFARFGEALGYTLRRSDDQPLVIIGRDTRKSGEMLQSAIVAGLINAGANVAIVGVLPTPAIGWLVKQNRASAGLMITASHNPYPDNGVKVFGEDGYKLSGSQQDEIEALISNGSAACSVAVERMGQVVQPNVGAEAYIDFAVSTCGEGIDLTGLNVCVDAANGAGASVVGPALQRLGANVRLSGVSANGVNINENCGALHPEELAKDVMEMPADIGIAFDGDADRIVMVDEIGRIIDGDQIMGAIAIDLHAKGKLAGDTLVATIMSNLGLEGALRKRGIKLERTKVGDRYVVERLREGGFSIGGEQSGHVVLSDFVTTGDALIASLAVLSIMVRQGKKASEVLNVFEPVPQLLRNIRYGASDPLASERVALKIDQVKSELGANGRVVVRKSGTEPLIRVMAEAYQEVDAEKAVSDIIQEIEAFGAAGEV